MTFWGLFLAVHCGAGAFGAGGGAMVPTYALFDGNGPAGAPSPEVQTSKPSASDEKHDADIKRDAELGAKYAIDVEKETKLSENKEYIERVQRIGGEIAQIARKQQVQVLWGDPRLSPFEYQFKVLKGDDVNAFSLPGGHIYVYEGLMKFVESDSELAGVLAHEVSHAAFRHLATLAKEQSKLDPLMGVALLIAIFKGGNEGAQAAMVGTLVTQAFTSGWSVKAETAADYGGFQFLHFTKYNPVGLLTFMERLAHKDRMMGNPDWGIFRTHPPSAERVRFLTAKLKDAGIPIRRSQVTTSLKASIKPGENGHVELWFGARRLYSFGGTDAMERADAAELSVNAFMDDVPATYEVQVRDKSSVMGQGKKLFDVVSDDLEGSNKTIEQVVKDAVGAIQAVVYDLSLRLSEPSSDP